MSERFVYGWDDRVVGSFGYIFKEIPSILAAAPAKRVLDLGAGNGQICGALNAKGFDVVGVERDEGGVDVSRRSFPKVPFYRFSVEDNPGELLRLESSFDAVVSTEVVEHLYSPHLLPRYAAQVLKPGGVLIVSTPYHGYLKNCLISLFGKWDSHHTPLWHGGHVKFWSRRTLTKLLESEGFCVESFVGVGRCSFLWKSMILVARKNN